MTFHQIKTGITCAILGAVLATGGYMLATASYVGSSTDLMLTPRNTDKGTQWNAEDKQIAVEVRYITSIIEKPTITIKKKQQWLPLAICLGSGFLIAYVCYKVAMRKSQGRHDEHSPIESTNPENLKPSHEHFLHPLLFRRIDLHIVRRSVSRTVGENAATH